VHSVRQVGTALAVVPAAWLALAGARAASAQEPRTQAPCNGQLISEVVVQTLPPSYGGLFSRSRLLHRVATTLHTTSTPGLVENLVLLRKGEPCSILLRRETERLLRAQPYLADASVTAYADGPDAVRIEVVTIDEPAVLGSIGMSGKDPWLRGLSAGSANLRGRGVSALEGWKDGGFYRDTWQARYSNFQLFSQPVQMHLTAIRRDHGYDATGLVAYPFFTDLQRRAWRVAGSTGEVLIPFQSPGREPVALGVRRQFVDAGAVARIGSPGLLAIVGGSVSLERGNPDTEAVLVTDSGLVTDTGSALRSRYEGFRSARVNLLLGYRQVNFLRVSGFDALAGSQDLRRGVQAALTIGRGLPMNLAEKDEVFVSGNLYGGVGSAASFAGLEVLARTAGGVRRLGRGERPLRFTCGRTRATPGRAAWNTPPAGGSGCRSSWR
jgi:hypothetical protein